MATRRPTDSARRLQASKLLATAVGVVAGGVVSGSEVSTVADPVTLLTVVGLGLAGVVSLEAAFAVGRLVRTSGGAVETTPSGYQALRASETVVAVCLLGGVVLWQLGGLGGHPANGGLPPAGVGSVAAGMIAVSFVRSAVALRG